MGLGRHSLEDIWWNKINDKLAKLIKSLGMEQICKMWQEVERFRECMEKSQDIQNHAHGRSDGQGAYSR